MNDLFIDKTNKIYNHYEYSLIQLNILDTYERLNLGVILSDKNGNCKFKTIPSIFEVSSCLGLKKLNGINFALQIATDRLLEKKTYLPGSISDELSISQKFTYTHTLNFNEALEQLFKENITISKGIENKNKTANLYDKLHILRSLKDLKSKKQIDTIDFNKEVAYTHKKIDVVGYKTNEHNKKEIIVGAEIVSPYVKDFMRNFSESFLVIKEMNANKDLKLKLLYMPKIKGLTNMQNKYFQNAKQIATDDNIKVIDSADYNEFLELIENQTKAYNQQLPI